MATSLMERALNTSVWIGLNDLKNQGMYSWSDGTSVVWTNWYFGQPDEKDIGKSCTYMNLDRSKKDWMFWRDGNCSREFIFMCKKQIGMYLNMTSFIVSHMHGCIKQYNNMRANKEENTCEKTHETLYSGAKLHIGILNCMVSLLYILSF